MAPASRSTPTTWRQSGASASATRPVPVPTSRTVSSPSGSAVTSDQNAGLTPAGAEISSRGTGQPVIAPSEAVDTRRAYLAMTPEV